MLCSSFIMYLSFSLFCFLLALSIFLHFSFHPAVLKSVNSVSIFLMETWVFQTFFLSILKSSSYTRTSVCFSFLLLPPLAICHVELMRDFLSSCWCFIRDSNDLETIKNKRPVHSLKTENRDNVITERIWQMFLPSWSIHSVRGKERWIINNKHNK